MLQNLRDAIAQVNHQELEEAYKRIIGCEFCNEGAQFAAVYNVMKGGAQASFSMHHCGGRECVGRAAQTAVALGWMYKKGIVLFHLFKILLELGFIEEEN